MPGLITPQEFVEEALDDYHSPTTSTFVEKMASCRQTISYLDQVSRRSIDLFDLDFALIW